MFCPRCGTKLAENSSFCRSCGAGISAANPVSTPGAENPRSAKKQKHTAFVISVIAAVAIVTCLIAYFMLANIQKKPESFDLSASISAESPSSPGIIHDIADIGISANNSSFSIDVVRTGSVGKILGLDEGDSLTIQGACSHAEDSSGYSYSLHAESFDGTASSYDLSALKRSFNDSDSTLVLPSSSFSSSFPSGRWLIQTSMGSFFADFDDSKGFSVGISNYGADDISLNGTWEYGETEHFLKLTLPTSDSFTLLIDVEFSF